MLVRAKRTAGFLTLVLATVGAISSPLAAQSRRTPRRPVLVDTATLQRILEAEDARGHGADSVDPLRAGLTNRDTLIRRVAARGIGRLQRPDLAPLLLPLLHDADPAIRAEAANAIAQSLPRRTRNAPPNPPGSLDVPTAAAALADALRAESNDATLDAIAESLGRLHFSDSSAARRAEASILARARTTGTLGTLHALYWLAVARATTGQLTPAGIELLRHSARANPDPVDRRLALLAVSQNGSLDSATAATTAADTDAQVRRLTLTARSGLSASSRNALAHQLLADRSPIVRVEALATLRTIAAPDCAAIMTAVRDSVPAVSLTAIDALGTAGPRCADRGAVATALANVIDNPPRVSLLGHGWQRGAHALVALAHVDSLEAARHLARAAESSGGWRIYAAQAAAVLHQDAMLRRLAIDSDNNVREAAIVGLSQVSGHGGDDRYIAALALAGYQSVRAAALALKGSRDSAAVPALLQSLDRLTQRRAENSRDPRMAILQRVDELGDARFAPRLTPYTSDFDTTVARQAAIILSRWTGKAVTATPVPLALATRPLAATLLAGNVDLRVTMDAASGGGSFVVRLFGGEAPATTARILALVDAHWYDGHQFQRVEPDFVTQGGGPDASEYAGDSLFLRDELAWRPQLRGTLGVSSRGRDTGDAQWYINLTDNIRLDHEYTVMGEIITGRDVAERILEGDRIATVRRN